MKHSISSTFQNTTQKHSVQCLLSVLALSALAACSIDSTAVSDSELIANFLVQNDNGEASAVVTLETDDLSGTSDVTLIRREAIFFEQDGEGGELSEEDDGEYVATLPDNASGLYTFIIERLRQDEFDNDGRIPELFEIDDNQVYLPDTFQELVAEPVQVGSVINISWRVNDTQQLANGFAVPAAIESFNAIASCSDNVSAASSVFDIAITEGQITQESGRQLLQIAVTDQLSQVSGLTAEAVTSVMCEFDVQLVRQSTGTTDVLLNRDSTAVGQTLLNFPVQWSAQ